MEVKLFNFSKRNNSTKLPSDNGTSVNVTLKGDTSMYQPTFLLSNTKTNYNYLKWDNRYYFINDVVKTTTLNLWELQCTIDLLGTYKSDILNTNAYVLYSTNKFNSYIVDDRINATTINNIVTYDSDDFIGADGVNWACVIQYISKADCDTFPTAYAVMSIANMKSLGEYLMSDSLSDSLEKQLDSVASSIVGCKWFYLSVPKGDTAFNITLGNGTTPVTARHLSRGTTKARIHLKYNLPYSDWRNYEPYTKWVLYLFGYGYIEIPSNLMLYYNGDLPLVYDIDWYNGTITWSIEGVGKFDGVIAVNIPVAYSGINAINTIASYVGAGAGLVGMFASMATLNVAGVVAGAGTALASLQKAFINENTKLLGTQGASSGSMSSIKGGQFRSIKPTLYRITMNTDDVNNMVDLYGKPLKKTTSLSDISGYVQTAGASINSNCPKVLKDEINELLDGGIYIE